MNEIRKLIFSTILEERELSLEGLDLHENFKLMARRTGITPKSYWDMHSTMSSEQLADKICELIEVKNLLK